MKRLLLSIVLLVTLVQPGLAYTQSLPSSESEDRTELPSATLAPSPVSERPDPGGGGMPPRPTPVKPIPYHEPGRPSRSASYTTKATQLNELGVAETVELTGVDAMVADGLDPLAGNHTLVQWDKLLFSAYDAQNGFALKTLGYTTPTLRVITDTAVSLGNYPANDVAAGDLNGDGLAEQIAAWIEPSEGGDYHLLMSIGEMPGAQRATSAPAVVPGSSAPPAGYALQFDGSDDIVWVSGIDLADNSFTVAFWARRGATDRMEFAIGQGTYTEDHYLHIGFRGDNRFTCAFYANDLDTPVGYTDTDWHHWACTYDATAAVRTIYRDGVQVAQDTGVAPYQGLGTLHIGQGEGYYFDGLIDEVGIWNVAHAQSQIQADMLRSTPEASDLEAYWHFDEGSGTTAEDASGNGHDGTLYGPEWTSDYGTVGDLHVLVRGYDEALWRCVYDVDSDACLTWDNLAGGLLASAPAVVSRAPGQFDVFALGFDNLVYQQHWDGTAWWSDWVKEPPDPTLQLFSSAMPTRTVPGPDWDAPAVVARDGGIDLFRVAPDNTLRWRRSDDGTTWGAWENLGGMLASGPGAVSLSATTLRVFARGVDDLLWTRSYDDTWDEEWQRVPLDGMAEGVTLRSAPTAISPATGELVIYVRGSDDQLWSVSYAEGIWGTWSAGGEDLASGVGAALWDGGQQLFALFSDGQLRRSEDGATWAGAAVPEPLVIYDTGALAAAPAPPTDYNNFDVDVATGHLLGNGREQIVVAYRDATNRNDYHLQVLDTVSGFEPAVVSEASTSTGGALRLTTGDFDGDGRDEIALVKLVTDTHHWQVQVWSAIASTLTLRDQTEETSVAGAFLGTLNIVAGDFEGDGMDEIAMSHDWARDGLSHLYEARFCIVDDLQHGLAKAYEVVYQPGSPTVFWTGSVGLALAAGNVDGDPDGIDEIVRMWPTGSYDYWFNVQRRIEVLDAGTLMTPTIQAQVSIPNWSSETYAEQLAVGDLDRDLVDEIAYFMVQGDRNFIAGSMQVHVYELNPAGSLTELAAAYPDPVSFAGASIRSTKLVAADTTGESLRVGPPNYRIQNRVDSVVAAINLPPQHRDYVKVDDGGGAFHYELFEVGLGSFAEHALSSGEESETGLQSQRDWAIGGGLDAKVTMGSAFVDTSLETSYGEESVDGWGEIATTNFTQSATASTNDRIVYFGTPYEVWEYPVLIDGSQEPADYITVIFPMPVELGGVPTTRTADTVAGDWYEAPWYRARHQTYNVWSYDPVGTPAFPDYDPTQLIVNPYCQGCADSYALSESSTTLWQTSKTKTHDFNAEVGVGYAGGFSFLGMKFGAEVRAHVNGSYSSSDVQTEKQTASESTDISWTLGGQTTNYYGIQSYGYWAKDGYLALDYQTYVPQAGAWAKYYSVPDPAFIRPWAGFPYGDAQVEPEPGLELFSPEIQVVPESASVGDSVIISATVRNFSNVQATNVLIRFCQGDPSAACAPGGTAHIGEVTLPRLNRALDGPVTVSVPWVASGSGKQRIYAVIDPENAIDPEVHDEDDLINNNIAYTTVKIGAAGIVDQGVASEQPYQYLRYDQAEAWTVSTYVPPGNMSEIVHFELQDAALSVPGAVGKPFELVSYEGDAYNEFPNYDLPLRPEVGAPPAVIALAQSDVSVATLKLYRATDNVGGAWALATCPGYEIVRFAADNLLYVPVCQAGLFVFATTMPGAVLAPAAAFSAAPTLGPAPLSVQFADQSAHAPTEWLWDFGDGSTSTEQHPVHVYTVPGTYGVTLTATNAGGVDSETQSSLINVGEASGRVYLPLVVR